MPAHLQLNVLGAANAPATESTSPRLDVPGRHGRQPLIGDGSSTSAASCRKWISTQRSVEVMKEHGDADSRVFTFDPRLQHRPTSIGRG